VSELREVADQDHAAAVAPTELDETLEVAPLAGLQRDRIDRGAIDDPADRRLGLHRHLYVASNLSGDIEVIDFDDTMTPLGPPTFFAAPGSTNLTGLGVDACDNVYALDATAAAVLRIRPQDAAVEVLVEAGVNSVAFGNLQWGSGIGGWDRETLYVLDVVGDRVVEIEVGVPDKPRAYP